MKTIYVACVNGGILSVHDTAEDAKKVADAEARKIAKYRLDDARRRGYPENPKPADVGIFPRVVATDYHTKGEHQ